MSNLDSHKVAGPDEIPSMLLKDYATYLASILVKTYQVSLNTATMPSDWLKVYVTPIFKKEDRACPVNYRLISLACIACKTLAHIINSQIIDYLQNFNLLTDAQHSFRPRRLCESQLHEIAKALDAGQSTDVVLLDFQKAFDKVPIED